MSHTLFERVTNTHTILFLAAVAATQLILSASVLLDQMYSERKRVQAGAIRQARAAMAISVRSAPIHRSAGQSSVRSRLLRPLLPLKISIEGSLPERDALVCRQQLQRRRQAQ